jgi:hypothetical protein
MSYSYSLATDATQGNINDIAMRWQASAYDKLPEQEIRTEQTQALLKALTEDFAYRTAYRLGYTSVKILYVIYNLAAFYVPLKLTNKLSLNI